MTSNEPKWQFLLTETQRHSERLIELIGESKLIQIKKFFLISVLTSPAICLHTLNPINFNFEKKPLALSLLVIIFLETTSSDYNSVNLGSFHPDQCAVFNELSDG